MHTASDEAGQDRRLEEVHVLAEMDWLRGQPNVKEAVLERGLQTHAFVYDKGNNTCVRLVENPQLDAVNGKGVVGHL